MPRNTKPTCNLIPAAGLGKRFSDAGYKLSKPLIPVDGLPMIVKAVLTMPKANQHVFVCQQEHLQNHKLDRVLKKYFPYTTIAAINQNTEGQASTCLLAEKYINPEAKLHIGACDNANLWSRPKLKRAMREADALIWTFRHNYAVEQNPRMYSWVLLDKNGLVQKVSNKIPISDNPIEDHALVGSFSFKKAKNFFDYAKLMVRKNRRINNEFYIDECMNMLIENGLKVKVFEVEKFICWGTPQDLRLYEYWQDYFQKNP